MFSINNITHPTPVSVNAALDDCNSEENLSPSSSAAAAAPMSPAFPSKPSSTSESRLSIQNLLSPSMEESQLVLSPTVPKLAKSVSEGQAEKELASPTWSHSCPSFFPSRVNTGKVILTDSSSPDEETFPSNFTSSPANSPSPSVQSPRSLKHPAETSRTVSKRRRANSTQLATLNAVFKHTFFPSTDLRERLGLELNMSPRSVQIWFQNKRQQWRQRRKLEEQMLQQQQHFPQHAQIFLHPHPSQVQPMPMVHPGFNHTPGSTVRMPHQRGPGGYEPAYTSIHHRLVPHPSSLPAFINPPPAGVIFAPAATVAQSPFCEQQMPESSNNPPYHNQPTYYYARFERNP